MFNKIEDHKNILFKDRFWIIAGGGIFTFIAGYVNAGLLSFFHVPVSHMSGAVSHLGIDLATGRFVDVKIILGIIMGFFIGAICSGLIIGGKQLIPGRRYGLVLVIEGFLLSLSAFFLMQHYRLGLSIAAMACGLQNAMASSYYGLVLRTTHVTGIVTDLGVLIGHWIRHKHIEFWKFVLLFVSLIGFFCGGVVGSYLALHIGLSCIIFASIGCYLSGIGYYFWKSYFMEFNPDITLESGRR